MPDYALALSDTEVARYRGMARQAAVSEAPLWAAAGIGPGASLVDVGCGPGAVLAEIAGLVGPTGRLVGVDADEGTLATARELLAAAGVDGVELHAGSAADTGLPLGGFDVVMLRHVLAHNGGSEQAIVDHLAALARPGGAVYLVDVDLTMMRVRPAPPDLQDLQDRYLEFHRRRGGDLQIGLRLAELARAAGLVVEQYRGWIEIVTAPPGMRPPSWAARDAMVAAGVATGQDVQRWGRALEELDAQAERPVVYPAVFAAVCRRPAAPA